MDSKALLGVTMYITYLILSNFHYMADILPTWVKSHNSQSFKRSRGDGAVG